MSLVRSLGLLKEGLIPVSLGLNTAVNSKMGILGALFLEICAPDNMGKLWSSKQLCYIASGLQTLYLSQDACIDLGVISKNFPQVGSTTTHHRLEV
jgi:hypothetical protein